MTIEELKKHNKVTDYQLDTEIEVTDMILLAVYLDNVEVYPVQLGLYPAEHQTVKYLSFLHDVRTGMDYALKQWRQHNSGAATYRALAGLLLRINKDEMAAKICQFLAEKCEC